MIDELPELQSSGLVPLASFENLGDAREYALVVLAMNLDCLITADEGAYRIHSNEAFAVAIHEEFRLYAEEQKMKPEPIFVPVFGSGVELALLWIGLLLYCFARQLENPELTERFLNSAGKIVEEGEIYRSLTSLFLHGDMGHLMGNAVFGMIFGILVANAFGPFRGWGLILLSGFLGNILNAWLHFPDPWASCRLRARSGMACPIIS